MDCLHKERSPCESEWSQMYRGGFCEPNPQGRPVTLHLLANPGCGGGIQRTVRLVLQALVPSPPAPALIWVSERELHRDPPHMEAVPPGLPPQPALVVVLFLREEEEEEAVGENRALRLLRAHLSRPPWRYHHTELLPPHRRGVRPYHPGGQDFYSLGGARDLPLWAVRQVHYGHEAVRYTLYCHHASFALAVALYAAILGRQPAAERDGFVCFSLFHPRSGCEVQLALKRLPPESRPSRLTSALLEFRVSDLWALLPLLPHPCTPISGLRWQTRDHDGNKILLQIREHSAVECGSGRVSLHSLCSSSPSSLSETCFQHCAQSLSETSRTHTCFQDCAQSLSETSRTHTCFQHCAQSLSETSRTHTCFQDCAQYRTYRCQRESAVGSPSSPEVLRGVSFTSSSSFSSSPPGSPSSSSVSPHPLPPCSYKADPRSDCLTLGHQKQPSPRLLIGHSAFRRVLPSATNFQPIQEQRTASPCLSPGCHSDEFYI
ncbi:uncharacterized protein LOC133125243 [Conger conger]|uniref:uncharacterized protein LOC133125243 n=1 Tax=Conger conger TaxID=82655 RepID=UPI002A5B0586|nr:uncharacterized protein LOC133125243 [Conger conger]